jgi:hypothetical protein
VIVLLLAAIVAAGAYGAAVWQSRPDAIESEVEWLEEELAWARRVNQAIRDDALRADDCVAPDAGDAPNERLEGVARGLRERCNRAARDGNATPFDLWGEFDGALFWAQPLPRARFEDDSSVDPRISATASSLAGRPIEARCWSDADWRSVERAAILLANFSREWQLAGIAAPDRSTIHLAPIVCYPLTAFAYTPFSPRANERGIRELARAVVVLAHEVRHVRHPLASESVVECYALQDIRRLVRESGRTSAYARELADFAWLSDYPDQHVTYRSPDCRNGGRLDLRPRDRFWP